MVGTHRPFHTQRETERNTTTMGPAGTGWLDPVNTTGATSLISGSLAARVGTVVVSTADRERAAEAPRST
jgi:hypothetical protein